MTDKILDQAKNLLALEEALLESMGGRPGQGDDNYWPRSYQASRVNALQWMIKKGELT